MNDTPTDFLIFYVDDDPEDLDVFAETAMAMDIKVIPISDLDEMESKIMSRAGLKVMFLDINMPGKSGYDVLKDIRKSNSLKNLPIVAFSTGHDAVTIKKCWDFGADLFIRKGSSLQEYQEIFKYVKAVDWSSFTRDPKAFVFKIQSPEN